MVDFKNSKKQTESSLLNEQVLFIQLSNKLYAVKLQNMKKTAKIIIQ